MSTMSSRFWSNLYTELPGIPNFRYEEPNIHRIRGKRFGFTVKNILSILLYF